MFVHVGLMRAVFALNVPVLVVSRLIVWVHAALWLAVFAHTLRKPPDEGTDLC